MTLSVIIVNWNVCELLRGSLRSLYAQTPSLAGEMEVIVVDNASSDDSLEMLASEFPGVVVISNSENVGFGRANNQALNVVHGRFLLLLNPDTVVLDGAIERMVERIQADPAIAVLGCRLVNGDGSFQRYTGGHTPTLRNLASHFLMLHKILPAWLLPAPLYLESDQRKELEAGWISGAVMMIRREAIGDKLFDHRIFMYGEDIELCGRLRRQGWKILYSPKFSVVHYDGRSVTQQPRRAQARKLKGMRTAFAILRENSSLLQYDVIVTVGFGLRAVFNSVAALLRPGRGYEDRASVSRVQLREAWRALREDRGAA